MANSEEVPEDDPNRLWCFCHQPQNGLFMISCDNCHYWFHGKCVKMTKRKNEYLVSEKKSWLCSTCLKRPPETQTPSNFQSNDDDLPDLSLMIREIRTRNRIEPVSPEPTPVISEDSTLKSSNPNNTPCPRCMRLFKGVRGLNHHMKIMHPGSQASDTIDHISDPNSFMIQLSRLKSNIPILKRVPKGARRSIAEELSKLIKSCTHSNTPINWFSLFIFPYIVLCTPDKKNKNMKSLTSAVKLNLDKWKSKQNLDPNILIKQLLETIKPGKPKQNFANKPNYLAKKVESKLSDGDVRGAIRILCSEDSLAPNDLSTFRQLQDKHPAASTPFQNIPQSDFTDSNQGSNQVPVTLAEIKKAIFSFPPGSAGGIDALRPQHLKDLCSDELGIFSANLLESLSSLCDLMFNGTIPEIICPILYGASLCALTKKAGGIRPIAVGCTLRRLTAKIGVSRIAALTGDLLRPTQLGFGTKSGCEAGAHSCRRYLSFPHSSTKVILKIDYFNAFNMLSRGGFLKCTQDFIPELYPFLLQCYGKASLLSYGEHTILSQNGCQQGDPLGPALFCLALHNLTSTLLSEYNIWYLDDGTLGDEPDKILQDLKTIITKSSELGLSLNSKKCELMILSDDFESRQKILQQFDAIAPGIQLIVNNEASLLGCPLTNDGISLAIQDKCLILKRLTSRLDDLNSHSAYFLLKNSLAIPRMTYLLRCSPSWRCSEDLKTYNCILRDAMKTITNCFFDDTSWSQSTLPVSQGGLGLRDITSLCFSAFLGSSHGVSDLLFSILPKPILDSEDVCYAEAFEFWSSLSSQEPPSAPLSCLQSVWDSKVCNHALENLLVDNTLTEKARLLAVQQKEAGAWLNAIPSSSIGTLLDNSSFRISIALRTGQKICESHSCTCGEIVDTFGYHGLSCRKSSGRRSRHEMINDIIKRALVSAEIPAIREPSGCLRSDGKRPDGMSLIPWKCGKPLVWDATCLDTLAPSYLDQTSQAAGEAARIGESRKRRKYVDLENNYFFVPFAVETFGPWGSEAKSFIRKIGGKIRGITNEKQSTSYLIQRISLAIQRGNAASILGTIPYSENLDEIFYS